MDNTQTIESSSPATDPDSGEVAVEKNEEMPTARGRSQTRRGFFITLAAGILGAGSGYLVYQRRQDQGYEKGREDISNEIHDLLTVEPSASAMTDLGRLYGRLAKSYEDQGRYPDSLLLRIAEKNAYEEALRAASQALSDGELNTRISECTKAQERLSRHKDVMDATSQEATLQFQIGGRAMEQFRIGLAKQKRSSGSLARNTLSE